MPSVLDIHDIEMQPEADEEIKEDAIRIEEEPAEAI